jgi:hypothetical protein
MTCLPMWQAGNLSRKVKYGLAALLSCHTNLGFRGMQVNYRAREQQKGDDLPAHL